MYYFGLVSITIAAFALFSLPTAIALVSIILLLVVALGLSVALAVVVAATAVAAGLVALLLPFWPILCCCYCLLCRKKKNNSTKPFAPKKEQDLPPKRKLAIKEPLERKSSLKQSSSKKADRSQIGLVEESAYTKNTLVTISDEED